MNDILKKVKEINLKDLQNLKVVLKKCKGT